jgi:hypothetical protein
MGPWVLWLWKLLRNKRFRRWLMATAGPRAIALFLLWIERVRHRQVAIGEARQIDGMFSAAIVDGERHVIVWKDGEPISSYPPVDGDLAAKLKTHARRDLVHPDELPSRRARRLLGVASERLRGGAHHAAEGAQRLRQLVPGGGSARNGNGNGDGGGDAGGPPGSGTSR